MHYNIYASSSMYIEPIIVRGFRWGICVCKARPLIQLLSQYLQMLTGNVAGGLILIARAWIQADDFLEAIRPKPPTKAQHQKEWGHGEEDPRQNEQQSDKICGKERGIRTAISKGIEPTWVRCMPVNINEPSRRSKESHSNNPPESAKEMNRNRIHSIVDA